MRHLRLSYRGAGILFWRRGESGAVEVLLGKRSEDLECAPGTWSCFGGKRHKHETYIACAYREAAEETAADNESVIRSRSHFGDLKPLMVACPWPFYVYRTFSCEVIREPEKWPVLNWEHTEAEWFMLDKLPRPVHSEAGRAVKLLYRSPGAVEYMLGTRA